MIEHKSDLIGLPGRTGGFEERPTFEVALTKDHHTWIGHTVVAVGLTLVGLLIGLPFGFAGMGALAGSLVSLGFYARREVRDWRRHMDAGDPLVRTAIDAAGDIAGPLIVWSLTWWVVL